MDPIVLLFVVGMFGYPIYKIHQKSKEKHGDKAYAWTVGYIGLGVIVALAAFGNKLLGLLLVIILAVGAVVLVKYFPRYAPEFLIKWVGSDTSFTRHFIPSAGAAPAPQQSSRDDGGYIDPGRNIPPNM